MMETYLEKNRRLIDKELTGYLPKKSSPPKKIHEAMRYSVLNGGKRLRPILLLESSRVCGGRIKDALPVACAFELIHTFSLVHDDLPSMDDALTRRGRPSCHIKYGEALAILTGDSLLTLAFNIIARDKNRQKTAHIMLEVSKAIGSRGMIGGQAMDLAARDMKQLDLPTVEYISIYKTASLIAAATKTGAVIAGVSNRKIEALKRYGEYAGLAFQVVDDILDRDGYAEILGINRAREESRRLIEKAKSSLEMFGRKADNLRGIAEFILNRKR